MTEQAAEPPRDALVPKPGKAQRPPESVVKDGGEASRHPSDGESDKHSVDSQEPSSQRQPSNAAPISGQNEGDG